MDYRGGDKMKKHKTKRKISSFAGMWKMSDKEAEELKGNIRKGWKSKINELEEVV